MSDENQNADELNELNTLKARADLQGIKYHPSIGLKSLKEKLQVHSDKINGVPETKESKPIKLSSKADFVSHSEYRTRELKERRKKAGSLVRVNVTCMNPDKKEWEGEIISVGSAKLGTYKKYVLFNAPDGWHIPHIIYEAMKERKCSVFHTVKDHLGNKVRKAKLINEFNIEVLPPLSKEELKKLAQRQAMANGSQEES